MTLADDIERQPIADPVNQPASGTQGQKADLDRLQESLPEPSSGPAGEQPPAIDRSGVTNIRSNRDASGLPGVPAPILAPTDRPAVPVSTRFDRGAPSPTVTPAQRRLAIIDAMANSPETSEEGREWARLVLRILTG